MARYHRDQWHARTPRDVRPGDYVVATKYSDGDPGDGFCIGFYDCAKEFNGNCRHWVVDGKGAQFRANGFRRVARVGNKRGAWLVSNIKMIEAFKDRYSVWHWCRAPWRVLIATENAWKLIGIR